jgi:hypothetical protein
VEKRGKVAISPLHVNNGNKQVFNSYFVPLILKSYHEYVTSVSKQ